MVILDRKAGLATPASLDLLDRKAGPDPEAGLVLRDSLDGPVSGVSAASREFKDVQAARLVCVQSFC